MFELAPPRATEQNLVEAPGLEKLPALANALAQSPYLSRRAGRVRMPLNALHLLTAKTACEMP